MLKMLDPTGWLVTWGIRGIGRPGSLGITCFFFQNEWKISHELEEKRSKKMFENETKKKWAKKEKKTK
jgi:hypothetical protein